MDDEIARLVNDLTRPIFNYRMATGLLGMTPASARSPNGPAHLRSAQTRLGHAEDEIHQAVWDYAHRTGLI